MSDIGLAVNLDEKARTKQQLVKQRKQREIQENNLKFGKQKQGVHGYELPPFASSSRP